MKRIQIENSMCFILGSHTKKLLKQSRQHIVQTFTSLMLKIFSIFTKPTQIFQGNAELVNIFFYIYKNGCTDVCCLSVGMWRANGNPNPHTHLDEILLTHPHMSKEGFGAGLTPAPSPPGPGGI